MLDTIHYFWHQKLKWRPEFATSKSTVQRQRDRIKGKWSFDLHIHHAPPLIRQPIDLLFHMHQALWPDASIHIPLSHTSYPPICSPSTFRLSIVSVALIPFSILRGLASCFQPNFFFVSFPSLPTVCFSSPVNGYTLVDISRLQVTLHEACVGVTRYTPSYLVRSFARLFG